MATKTHWVPYHVDKTTGAVIKKVDMRGQVLRTREEALAWLSQGHLKTHPALAGERLDCTEEPLFGKTH